MALDTDLSLSPYFDDFSANASQYAVLYRPGVPVQAREMNQVQSILQDQIFKFGKSIYKEGSVIEGCAFTFDNKYAYVKINDTYSNGSAITVTDFIGRTVTNANGLKATIVNAESGFQSQNPDLNTLYIKYLNATTYPANGAIQLAFANTENLVIATTGNVAIGNVTVATVANSVGLAYALNVSDGVVFKKGYFIRVPAQTVVVPTANTTALIKYSNQPNNVSVGFGVIESIETPASNTQLYDNAQGAPNFGAPGAHRLKLTPNLIVRRTDNSANTDTFFSICDFQGGRPITIKNDPQYSALGTELARRTFETNGDFVVNPFLLTTETKKANNDTANTSTNTTYLDLVSTPGLAYPKGYRVEFLNRSSVNLRKGNDEEAFSTRISANFGYYVYVNQFVGDFNTDNIAQIELHSAAANAISSGTFLSTAYPNKKIGTAFIRGVQHFSGTPGVDAQYIVYLFNIKMNAGANFSQVKSLVYYPSSTVTALSDVVLTLDYSSGTNIAVLNEITSSTMIFPFGQRAVVPTSFNNTAFIYRNRANNVNFDVNGNMTVPITGAGETFTYGAGSLSQSQMETFIVVPTTTSYTPYNSGTVTSSGNTLTGVGTYFNTNYRAGDVVRVANSTSYNDRVITSVSNDTYLAVNSNFSVTYTGVNHQQVFPSGQPISFLNRPGRSISITSNTTQANVSLGVSISNTTTFNAIVYHDVLKSSATPIKKNMNRGTLIKIDTATNPAGATGPWCLGVTDVLQVNHVWVSTSGSYSSSVVDSVSSFTLDNGQRDACYDLAYLKPNVTSVPAGSKIIVSVDHFTHDQTAGKGFFTANSYPIDDVYGAANSQAIVTAQIPRFTSPTKGSVFDLRDCVDFRPFVGNTAVITSTLASSTVNPSNTSVFSGPADSSIQGVDGAYIISPNQLFTTNLRHYLPRIDRVSLTTGGQLLITEGIPDTNPRAPSEIPGTMAMGTIDVPPYPTLSALDAKAYNRYDYAPTINISQIKRYTMADIGSLATRIKNLEYYTSLSTLEQTATNLQIRSGATGQNRFKNGILVDPFRGHDIGNTLHPQYSIAIDANKQEARPFFRMWNSDVVIDENLSTGYALVGNRITLDFTQQLFQQQPYASKFHNCIEGNIYNWRGSISLTPPGDTQPDRTASPDVVNNLDLASNWINLRAQQAWGTSWGNWVTKSSSTAYGSAYQTGASSSATNSDGSINTTYYTNINTTTTLNQVRTGTQTNVSETNNTLNLGTYATDISVKPYVQSRILFFSAHGLKPNTIVYPYFNNTRMSSYCKQMYLYTGAYTTINNITWSIDGQQLYVLTANKIDSTVNLYFASNGKNYGSSLVTSADGSLYGIFSIPANTFKNGDIPFRLTDVSDLTQGESAITTDATVNYLSSGLTVSYGKSTLNTRQAQLTQTQVTETQTVYQNGVVSGPPVVVYTPPPPPAPVIDYAPSYGWWIWEPGYGSNSDGGN